MNREPAETTLMKSSAIWFYSPSLLSQALIPMAVIAGIVGAIWAAPRLDVVPIVVNSLTLLFVILLPVAAFFLYGRILVFNSVDRRISVKTFLWGVRVNQKMVSFADVQAITLTLDTEGFPGICLKLDNGKRYYFCTFSTRNDYVRICDMLGRHP